MAPSSLIEGVVCLDLLGDAAFLLDIVKCQKDGAVLTPEFNRMRIKWRKILRLFVSVVETYFRASSKDADCLQPQVPLV